MLAVTVDFESDVPIYRQIADEIRALVARGQLEDGDVLPSVRRLGQMVGVNLNTVARAYRILADEGLVELRRGAGAVVRVPVTARREALSSDDRKRLDDIISRMVLGGASRADVERALHEAVRGFFKQAK